MFKYWDITVILPRISLIRFYLFTAVFLLLSLNSPSYAVEDKLLLDSLQKKGILTSDEVAQIAKSQAVVATIARPETQVFNLSSRMQFQMEYTNSEVISGNANKNGSTMDFLVRRIFLQADAKLRGGFDVRFSVELGRNDINSFFTDTYISKSFDYQYLSGKLYAGYMKPRFAYEDVMSSFSLYAIERSVSSFYWSGTANGKRLGVGNRYCGVFWFGDVPRIKGLKYWTSVTNSFQLLPLEDDFRNEYEWKDNNLAYWFGASYDLIDSDGDKFTFGCYTSYSSTANKKLGIGTDFASIWSLNPYIAGNYENLYFWADFLTSGVADGRILDGQLRQANPYGTNICFEYRIAIGDYGKIAPVFRFSWLDTGGRGVGTRDGVRHSINEGTYNDAIGFYGGVNWYIRGDDLKIQLGYEYVQYANNPQNRSIDAVAEAQALRIQFQMKL